MPGNQYLIGNNFLTQLDSAGNLYTGKLAERYVLRRNEITEKNRLTPTKRLTPMRPMFAASANPG